MLYICSAKVSYGDTRWFATLMTDRLKELQRGRDLELQLAKAQLKLKKAEDGHLTEEARDYAFKIMSEARR